MCLHYLLLRRSDYFPSGSRRYLFRCCHVWHQEAPIASQHQIWVLPVATVTVRIMLWCALTSPEGYCSSLCTLKNYQSGSDSMLCNERILSRRPLSTLRLDLVTIHAVMIKLMLISSAICTWNMKESPYNLPFKKFELFENEIAENWIFAISFPK